MGPRKKITIGIIAITLSVLIAWDIYVAVHPAPGDTVSELTLAASMRFLWLPFALGVLVGHFSWPGPKVLVWWVTVLWLTGCSAVLFALHLVHWYYPLGFMTFLQNYPILVALAGVPAGRYFWPQVRPSK